MAVDYSTLKKGGFMRQKQKIVFSSIGSRRRKLNRREFEDNCGSSRQIWRWTCSLDLPSERGNSIYQIR